MNDLINALKSLGLPVGYIKVDKNAQLPYIVYTDYGERYTKADNHINTVIVNVQVDYYTDVPLDENKWKIRKALDEADVTFSYKLLYDSSEKVYHHIFDCEVLEDEG